MDMELLRWHKGLSDLIKDCESCPLHKSRKNPCPGNFANKDKWPSVMIIGEAPGANEDEIGKVFVGQAGKILRSALKKSGWLAHGIFITNTVKCRPPGNRKPTKEEIERCSAFLKTQAEYISPRIIIAFGKIAEYAMDTHLNKIKAYKISFWHPAYLLRARSKLQEWEDQLREAHETFGPKLIISSR